VAFLTNKQLLVKSLVRGVVDLATLGGVLFGIVSSGIRCTHRALFSS